MINSNTTQLPLKKTRFAITLLVICNIFVVSSCGFHLRGSETGVLKQPNIVLTMQGKSANERLLKKNIVQQLKALGANVTDSATIPEPTASNNAKKSLQTTVAISNLSVKKYELVGTLTEVSLVLKATIRLASSRNEVTRTLQTQRSYQYNQATVNTKDAEEKRIIELMYAELADKVLDQVVLFESNTFN